MAATSKIPLYNDVVNSFLAKLARVLLGMGVLAWAGGACALGQENSQAGQSAPTGAAKTKSGGGKQTTAAAAAAIEQQDLQKAIEQASNDRAALMHNLMEYLKKYPQSSQRPQIYRAIVESSLQIRDFSTATEYAERMVALDPGDLSTNLLSVQLLERYGDAAGWRRATNYCARVIELIGRESANEKSPRVSNEQFEKDKQRDAASIYLVRGRLHQKLSEMPDAQKDFEESFRLAPGAAAAERLGELAELRKDLTGAIHHYALAFALAEGTSGGATRAELRKKLGNVWRLAHGSEDGLGEYLLRAYDENAAAAVAPKPARNLGLKEPSEFVLRRAPDALPYALAGVKGKVLVMNFWTTWCGPCREWEPHFEKVAGRFAGREKEVVFLEVNCDEDETLVGPYLAEEKPKTNVLFADGLDLLLGVNSFPTTLVLDRTGKIAYRGEGVDMENPEASLMEAIEKTLHAGEMAMPAPVTQ
ncbi:MAG TPA: redoxin family protein [Candidatus Limnocylindrales bacterium]|nr:redoxin family protein [Candidatus Limnocylindrales bacterium]